jgi:hypothetical protein
MHASARSVRTSLALIASLSAPLARADPVLDADAPPRANRLHVETAPSGSVQRIYHTWTYPDSVLEMEDPRGWFFGGAVRGHRGGARQVDAPGRSGKAMEFWAKLNTENPNSPAWVFWQHPLDPELMIENVESAEVDVYPLDPLPFRITARFGSGDGLGVVPATWSSLGTLRTGVWQTVSIPVNFVRPHVDTLRFDMSVRQRGVPHLETFRFLVGEVRFVPPPTPRTSRALSPLDVDGPLRGGLVVAELSMELADEEPLVCTVELTASRSFDGTLALEASCVDDTRRTWSHPVRIDAPATALRVRLDRPALDLPTGPCRIAVRLKTEAGAVVAESSDPLPLALFRSRDFMERKGRAFARTEALRSAWEALVEKGMTANLPGSTLATAQLFLQPGGFLEDDFFRQKKYAIAQSSLRTVEGLLDRAAREIQAIENGDAAEPDVARYDPRKPVIVERGILHQGGTPMLFIGGIGWTSRVPPKEDRITERIGFNCASHQAQMRNWIGTHPEALAWRDRYMDYLEETLAAGFAINVLISGHYPPSPMPEQYEGARDSATGSSMLPWNLVAPQTLQLYYAFYDQFLPALEGYPHILNAETANEPNHHVSERAENYGHAFIRWAIDRHGSFEAVNALWGSGYHAVETFDLQSFFDLRETSPAANTDWHHFLTEIETDFFRSLKERIRATYPDLDVTLKLMGHDKHFGYPLLNEQTITAEAQTLLGTDGSDPMWQDYLKSLKPGVPVINAEWHFIDPSSFANPALLQRRMFEGVAHGIGFGAIWNWRRTDWDSLSNGADQSFTRLPITLDAIGRGAWKLRPYAGALGRFANQDGGRVRLMFSIHSKLHQGMDYQENLESVYWRLSQNASGVRFLIPDRLRPGGLEGVELIAAGSAGFVPPTAAGLLREWVRAGGVLWLFEPGLQQDPHGRPLDDLPEEWRRAVGREGVHTVGAGIVFVGPEGPPLERYFDGPWAVGEDGAVAPEAKVRVEADGEGGHWLYLMSRSDEPQTVRLESWPDGLQPRRAFDHWNRREVDLGRPIYLPPHGVLLTHLRSE